MLIYILLLTFIIMLVGSYYLFKKEIMQPSIIFLFMYTFSIACAVLNVKTWGIHMSKMTFLILVLGAVEFIVVSYITQRIYKNKTKYKDQRITMKKIEIPKWIVISIIAFCILTIIIQLLVVFDIATRYEPYKSISRLLTVFKEHTSYNKDVDIPGILTLMHCRSYCMCIFININIPKQCNFRKQRKVKMCKKILKLFTTRNAIYYTLFSSI